MWYIGYLKKDVTTKNILLQDDKVVSEHLAIKLNKMVPGANKNYTIILKAPTTSSYEVNLAFTSINNSILSKYINVEISYQDSLKKYRLCDLIDDLEQINYLLKLKKGEKAKITIKYNLPYEVGNEIQGMSIDFNVNFKVKRL